MNLIPLEDNFKKILSRLDVEYIEEILNDNEFFEWDGFPQSGTKEKWIEIILKNATIFESFIDDLFFNSNKKDRKLMCDDLGINSNSKAGELKKKILDKVNETIDNRDIQNKISFLSSAFLVDELEYILDKYEMSTAGKKERLVKNIASNDFLLGKAMIEWKKELQKDNIKKICNSLDIDSEGNRENLLQRINDYVFKNEVKIDLQKESVDRTTKSIKNIGKTNSKNLQKNMRRGWSVAQKEIVRIRQEGKCDMCKKFAPGWHYHHVDGDNNNNKMDNCVGLCPNCHYFELK